VIDWGNSGKKELGLVDENWMGPGLFAGGRLAPAGAAGRAASEVDYTTAAGGTLMGYAGALPLPLGAGPRGREWPGTAIFLRDGTR